MNSLRQNIRVRRSFLSGHGYRADPVPYDAGSPRPLDRSGCGVVGTQGLPNKPVECETDVRVLLRLINGEVTGDFIDFILHGVRRYDLGVDGNDVRRLLLDINSMPGVSLEQQSHQIPE